MTKVCQNVKEKERAREKERERMPLKNACICPEPGFNDLEQTAINIVIEPIVIMRIIKGGLDFNKRSKFSKLSCGDLE